MIGKEETTWQKERRSSSGWKPGKRRWDAANAAYIALLSGQVQSYTIGSRNLTRLDLSSLEETIRRLEKEIDELEEMLRSGKRRKAVGVIPRDW